MQMHSRNKTDATVDEVQVVEFSLGEDKFAINLFDVRENVESFSITPLPHAASYVKGIIDLRGEITTVIDLKSILKITHNNSGDLDNTRKELLIWIDIKELLKETEGKRI
jgi:chemotaxis signal transduction protein